MRAADGKNRHEAAGLSALGSFSGDTCVSDGRANTLFSRNTGDGRDVSEEGRTSGRSMWELGSHTPVHSILSAYIHIYLYWTQLTSNTGCESQVTVRFIEVSAFFLVCFSIIAQTHQTDASYCNPGILVNAHFFIFPSPIQIH